MSVIKDGFLDIKSLPKTLTSRFGAPPFSILDSRQGYWQKRKRAWIDYGIKSELGRGEMVSEKGTSLAESQKRLLTFYENNPPKRKMASTTVCATEWMKRGTDAGGSIFDPTLCEMMYKWFCPAGGQVVDPFAGGSVRGIVATTLGFNYWGCDLRKEQIQANIEQAEALKMKRQPLWVCGDSNNTLRNAPKSDFIFSCPPYGDLEVYSDDPADISNMSFDKFIETYRRIIFRSCRTLNENRFACFVVGDYRDKAGNYTNFVSETIQAFLDSGLQLYNEIIYITPTGSLPVRATRQFNGGRKVGKAHQNVLVFVKGDGKKAAKYITGEDNED